MLYIIIYIQYRCCFHVVIGIAGVKSCLAATKNVVITGTCSSGGDKIREMFTQK